MAKKAKGNRVQVILECTGNEEQRSAWYKPLYNNNKNRKNTAERLELKSIIRFLREMTLHKEVK